MHYAAIPTTYDGVNFRSRLEAKWARFFTLIEAPWVYEPFDLPDWIPDFEIEARQGKVLVEVKPAETSGQLISILLDDKALCKITEACPILAVGNNPSIATMFDINHWDWEACCLRDYDNPFYDKNWQAKWKQACNDLQYKARR